MSSIKASKEKKTKKSVTPNYPLLFAKLETKSDDTKFGLNFFEKVLKMFSFQLNILSILVYF